MIEPSHPRADRARLFFYYPLAAPFLAFVLLGCVPEIPSLDDGTGSDADTGSEDTTEEGTGDAETGDGDGDGDPGDGDGDGDGDGGEAMCGNGLVEGDEQCDDGNDVGTDECLVSCQLPGCGDGLVWKGHEACDDGINDGSYDGCAVDCLELGPRCGDGMIDEDYEVCDDENDTPDDGCTVCAIDALNCCEGEPSVCTHAGDFSYLGTNLDLVVPDDLYQGTLETMLCVDMNLSVPESCAPIAVGGVVVEIGIQHTFIGDLTFKLVSPSATTTTLLSRPGYLEPADDGSSLEWGDSSDLQGSTSISFIENAATDAESMGSTIEGLQHVCEDDMLCEFAPNPGAGPGLAFEDYLGEPITGIWKVCIGDSTDMDTGTLQTASVSVTPASL